MVKLYPGMAFTNMKSSRKTYIPYIISCIITIAMFYIVSSLAGNSGLSNLWGGEMIQSYMSIGQWIVALFAVIFLFYINSFLMKRRTREFGLYNILGLEKRHISKIIGFETLYTFIVSMALGIGAGIVLDKLMYLIILKMLGASIPMGFYVSAAGIFSSLILFGAIFLLIFLNSVRHIRGAKPVELLRSESAGEKEPKAKWALAVLGAACLAAGYIIAITTENPVSAFAYFFGAVGLVIVGTYMLFTAGSIALLKLLKKNRNYYYKSKHFVSVSGMMYRMKRNAVGLANICILSTMVLVTVSATISIYAGMQESIMNRYPSEICVSAQADEPNFDEAVKITEDAFAREGLEMENQTRYRSLTISAVKEGSEMVTDTSRYEGLSSFDAYNRLMNLVFVPLEDYNTCMNMHQVLNEGEILVYSNRQEVKEDELEIFDCSFKIKNTLSSFMKNGSAAANITNSYFIVVKDMSVIEELYEANAASYGENASDIVIDYMADVKGDSEENRDNIMAAYENTLPQLENLIDTKGFHGTIECRTAQEDSFHDTFSGLYFLGTFLSLLFTMAAILIMYYKQITEGYEDKKRFEILQNVGMSHREVKRTINSQVLTVFFLPLITAGVHVAFAFPFIFRILMLLNFFNMKLFALCTAGTFLAFAVLYVIVYKLTARLYYGIVKK